MMEDIQKLLSKLSHLHKVEQERIKKEKEDGKCFNVFSALNLGSDEVRLHSRLLATLLNPNADHGLGDVFLKSFLGTIDLPENYITHCKGQLVERYVGEVTQTDGGRIDIILEDGNHAIIIENKIYASDQPNQLLRYYNYGKKEFGENNFKLVYLTLYGCEPSEISLGGEIFNVAQLSYGQDVLNLLEEFAQSQSPKPIHRTIQDYIAIIKQLTSQDMDTTYKENVIQEAIDNISATSILLQLSEEMGKEIRDRYIFSPLKTWANDQNISYKETEDNGALLLVPQKWTNYAIRIKTDNRHYWERVWISIIKNSNSFNSTEERKLDCFSDPPHEDNLFGWSWISDDEGNNWHDPAQYPQICEEEVLYWIQDKIEEIINLTENEQF